MAQAILLYVGTTSGVVVLSNPGRIDRWITVGQELAHEVVVALTCESDNPMQVAVQTEEGFFASADGGQSWTSPAPTPLPAPLMKYVFPGAPAATVRIVTGSSQPERSSDGEETWERVLVDSVGAWTVIVGPEFHADQAFAGTATGELLYSHDRGRTWTIIKRELPPVRAIAVGRALS